MRDDFIGPTICLHAKNGLLAFLRLSFRAVLQAKYYCSRCRYQLDTEAVSSGHGWCQNCNELVVSSACHVHAWVLGVVAIIAAFALDLV